jgi:hypothetical protein
MDIKNKQAAVTSPISESDMRKGFKKYQIHLKLDQDTKTMHWLMLLSKSDITCLLIKRMANGKFKQTFINSDSHI